MTADLHESTPEDTREKLRRAREGDRQAREALVEENMALVRYLTKRFYGRGDAEDLFQYGCMGLLKAIDHFNPDYDVRFSTYAVPVILGEIRRFLRDDHPIHISRAIHDNARRMEAFRENWRAQTQTEPDVDEVAAGVGISREDVLMALNARLTVRSLNEPVGDGDLRLMDTVGTEPMREIDSRLTLSQLLRDLPPEERALIVRRYFRAHTQTEIARDMGVSQVQVSRMERRILQKLRAAAES